MTNNVSLEKYTRFNRQKSLSNMRTLTAKVAMEKLESEQKVVTNSPEKSISRENS